MGVIQFPGVTTADETPEGALKKAKTWNLKGVIIIGWTEDEEFKFGGSMSSVPDINYLLDRAKQYVMP